MIWSKSWYRHGFLTLSCTPCNFLFAGSLNVHEFFGVGGHDHAFFGASLLAGYFFKITHLLYKSKMVYP